LDPCVLYPASECDFLVLIAGDIGKLSARSSRRLVFFGSNEGKFAVCACRYVGSVVGLFLRTLSEFAGFGCSFLLRLGYREYLELERKGTPLTFSFSFCAFFSAFLEGGSAPVGAASLIVVVLWISSRVVQWSVVVLRTHISIVGQSQPRYPPRRHSQLWYHLTGTGNLPS
jgi:hypothetical protein